MQIRIRLSLTTDQPAGDPGPDRETILPFPGIKAAEPRGQTQCPNCGKALFVKEIIIEAGEART